MILRHRSYRKLRCIEMKKTALVVTTIGGFVNSFELNDISILQDMGYTVHVATNMHYNDFDYESIFAKHNIVTHQIYFERSPINKANFKAIGQLKKIIFENGVSLVHCHTPVGGVIGRLAAKKFRKMGCKVIYSVHGLQFYEGAPKKDWMIYYPIEKYFSRFSDAIITINREDYDIVKTKMKVKKTFYIPGVGINYEKFHSVNIDRTKKRSELGVFNDDIMVFSVGELIERKNYRVVIDAISKINKKNLKYIIVGPGPLSETLQYQIDSLGLHESIKLLGERTDVNELMKCADIFVHPARREGLPVALMEAMSSGVPVVCSRIRGNVDLIDDGKGGILCDVDSVDDYANGIQSLINNEQLRRDFVEYSDKKIKDFSLTVVDRKMRGIYSTVLNKQ